MRRRRTTKAPSKSKWMLFLALSHPLLLSVVTANNNDSNTTTTITTASTTATHTLMREKYGNVMAATVDKLFIQQHGSKAKEYARDHNNRNNNGDNVNVNANSNDHADYMNDLILAVSTVSINGTMVTPVMTTRPAVSSSTESSSPPPSPPKASSLSQTPTRVPTSAMAVTPTATKSPSFASSSSSAAATTNNNNKSPSSNGSSTESPTAVVSTASTLESTSVGPTTSTTIQQSLSFSDVPTSSIPTSTIETQFPTYYASASSATTAPTTSSTSSTTTSSTNGLPAAAPATATTTTVPIPSEEESIASFSPTTTTTTINVLAKMTTIVPTTIVPTTHFPTYLPTTYYSPTHSLASYHPTYFPTMPNNQRPTSTNKSSKSPTSDENDDEEEQQVNNNDDEENINEQDNNNEQVKNNNDDDVIFVNLPRIICDITLSSDLSEKLQQKHMLLVAMTNTIYDLLDTATTGTSLEYYTVVGIALSVVVTRLENEDADVDSKEHDDESDNESDENADSHHENGGGIGGRHRYNRYNRRTLLRSLSPSPSSTIRLNAEFSGTASFSTNQGAPTENDLVNLLLNHFNIEEFTNRLKSPLLRVARSSDEVDRAAAAAAAKSPSPSMLKVNAVYFSLRDGSIVEARATTLQESMFPIKTNPNGVRGEGVKEAASRKMQITVVFFVLVAMSFVLVLIILVIHANRLISKEEDGDADSSNEASLEEEYHHDSTSKCVEVDLGQHRVEIHVPQTPQIPRHTSYDNNDDDDVSMELSEISTLSGSPNTIHNGPKHPFSSSGFGITTSPGLGITPPNYRYRRGVPVPYYSGHGTSIIGVDAEEWRSSYLSDALETP